VTGVFTTTQHDTGMLSAYGQTEGERDMHVYEPPAKAKWQPNEPIYKKRLFTSAGRNFRNVVHMNYMKSVHFFNDQLHKRREDRNFI
jgi:hypothetical protein